MLNSRPVHSLMLSSHLFLCPPRLLPPFTVPCKMVLARPDQPLRYTHFYALSMPRPTSKHCHRTDTSGSDRQRTVECLHAVYRNTQTQISTDQPSLRGFNVHSNLLRLIIGTGGSRGMGTYVLSPTRYTDTTRMTLH